MLFFLSISRGTVHFIDQNIPLTKNEGKSPPIKDLPHGRREPEMNALSLSRGKLKMNALSFSRGKLLCHLSKSISGLRRGRFFHSRIWYRAVRSTRISFSDRKRPRKAIIRSNKVIILLLSWFDNTRTQKDAETDLSFSAVPAFVCLAKSQSLLTRSLWLSLAVISKWRRKGYSNRQNVGVTDNTGAATALGQSTGLSSKNVVDGV